MAEFFICHLEITCCISLRIYYVRTHVYGIYCVNSGKYLGGKILIAQYVLYMDCKIAMNRETGILKTSRKTIKHGFTRTIN